LVEVHFFCFGLLFLFCYFVSKVQKASTSGTAQSIGRMGGRQAAGSSGPPSAARKASPARRLANSVMPATVKSTKKSAANDNLTKLKERLVRGERLTEDELVQLELAAVSRYDALQRQDESRQEGSSSIAVSSNAGRSSSGSARNDCSRPQKQAASTSSTQQPKQRDGVTALTAQADELRELRELRDAAAKERARQAETANELARLRQLRLEVSNNPQAALNISTGRDLVADPCQYAVPSMGDAAAYNPGAYQAAAATVTAVSGIQGQLRAHLASNHGKVLDLFRRWDVDGDGTVRKVEMRRAVASLGIEAPPSAIDALFDSFDRDAGGGIEYKELCRVLRREAETELRLRAGMGNGDAVGAPSPPPASSGGVFGWLTGGSKDVVVQQQQQQQQQPRPRAAAQPAPPSAPPPPPLLAPAPAPGDAGEDEDMEVTDKEEGESMDDIAAMIYRDDSMGAPDDEDDGKAGGDAAAAAARDAGRPASAARSNVSLVSEMTTTSAKGSSSTTPNAKAKGGAGKKVGKPDPMAARDGALWELISLVEVAAPWAAWHAADTIGAIPNLAPRPSDPSPPAAAITPTGRPKSSLPPVRSVFADALSLLALLIGLWSLLSQPTTLERALLDLSSHGRRLWPGGGRSEDVLASDAAAKAIRGGSSSSSSSLSGGDSGSLTSANSAMALLPLHAFAALSFLALMFTLLRHFYTRLVPPSPQSAEPHHAGKAPMLPLTTPTSGAEKAALAITASQMPFAHWSTLALAELFLAAYFASRAMQLAPMPINETEAKAGAAEAAAEAAAAAEPLLAWQLAASSAALLLAAAFWRALLVLLWHLRWIPCSGAAPAVAPMVAPKAPAAKPSSKPAPPAKQGPTALASALAALAKCLAKAIEAIKLQFKKWTSKGAGTGKGAAAGKAGGRKPAAAATKSAKKPSGKKSMV
jgi:hypothetical protein